MRVRRGARHREAQRPGDEREKRGDERNDGLVTFPMLERMQIAHCPLATGLGGSGLVRLVLCFAGQD